jgi:DNA-binding winged helix-turn-helix (wHTH) protein/TolB-like protein/Tfp pilus assembly protein PilF
MAIHFGRFTFDESRRLLLKGADPVHLSPKAFQLLSILLRERPRAVSKRDLLDQLWPDRIVSEGNLASAVAEVRSALDDDPHAPRFIRTFYGFGYAFAAAAEEGDRPFNNAALRWRIAAYGALPLAASLVFILAIRTWQNPHGEAPARLRSLAVLPFDTTGDSNTSDKHLGLGLADLVIARLTNVHQLVVRPTSAIRRFAGRHTSSLNAGRELGVDAVLEGTIHTTPDRVRVTVQLLNVREQKPIWAGEFDQKRSDTFMIEDKISEQVADTLTMQLSPRERALLAKHYTADPEAYDLYIRARYQQQQWIGYERSNVNEAIMLLQEAVEKDSSYALAWATLAEFYASSAAFGNLRPADAFSKAEIAVHTALQLDDAVSEAHCSEGVIKMYWDLDYARAEREFLRALQLNPRNLIALMHYGRLVQCLGRFDEAIALRKRAIEIDPLSPAVRSHLAAAYLTARRDDLGIKQCLLVLHMDPHFSFAHISLARIYTLRGECDKAITEAREAVRTENGNGYGLQSLAILGYTLGMCGRTKEAGEVLRRIENDRRALPFDLAIVNLALGHRDKVLRLLDRALDDRTYGLRLKTEPIFDSLRSDPRFKALLRRARLES